MIAAAGRVRRTLPAELPEGLTLPEGFRNAQMALPGVLVVSAPECRERSDGILSKFSESFAIDHPLNQFPLCVLVDDADFAARHLNNFLWTTFTRSDPAADIDGIHQRYRNKHWSCKGALVIDARIKPHHAPPLIEDPQVSQRVDDLAASGGPLHGII